MERSQLFKEAPFVLKLWFILYCLGISMFFYYISIHGIYKKSCIYCLCSRMLGCLFFPNIPYSKINMPL